MQTHTDRLLHWFAHKQPTITPREAAAHTDEGGLSNMRLADSILTLRERGYIIETELQHGRNPYGTKVVWARYRFVSAP